MKTRRQSAIVDVIRRQPIRSQEQLRRAIHAAGFDVTQATLSRDIRELALVKGGPDGAYQAPGQGSANGHGATARLPARHHTRDCIRRLWNSVGIDSSSLVDDTLSSSWPNRRGRQLFPVASRTWTPERSSTR
jgi:hypothetical protein